MASARVAIVGSDATAFALSARLAGVVGGDGVVVVLLDHPSPAFASALNTSTVVECDPRDHASLLSLLRHHAVSLVVVLSAAATGSGAVDAVRAAGLPVFGGTQGAAAAIHSRSGFKALKLPHPPHAVVGLEVDAVLGAVECLGNDCVVKADHHATVLQPDHLHDAAATRAHVEALVASRAQADAVVVERRLEGVFFSVVSLSNGKERKHIAPVFAHKREGEGDVGQVVGGGAGAWVDADLSSRVVDERAVARAKAIADDLAGQVDLRGALCCRFVVAADEVWVLSARVGFGACEGVATMASVERADDLLRGGLTAREDMGLLLFTSALGACARGEDIADLPLRHAVATRARASPFRRVASDEQGQAPGPAPTAHSHGLVMCAPDSADNDGKGVWVGAQGADLADARRLCRGQCEKLKDLWWRRDIGSTRLVEELRLRNSYCRRFLGHEQSPVKIGVLASTNCTDLDAILSAIRGGRLSATIAMVVSNRGKAGVVDKCKRLGLPFVVVGAKDRTREEFDGVVTEKLKAAGVELVLGIGFMRILSEWFCDEWSGRVMNVHPSLLPAFAGGMDLDVHAEVLKAGVKETGCTVHMIEKEVDGGKVVVQRSCVVRFDDTPETLKAKVQRLEGSALVDAIRLFQCGEHLSQPQPSASPRDSDGEEGKE